MKNSKKILSLTLSALMLMGSASTLGAQSLKEAVTLSPFSFSARAEEVSVLDEGTCGENVNYRLTSDGLLSVFAVNGETDGKINADAFKYSYAYLEEIKTIEIGDGITEIGKGAFYACGVRKVTIGNDVKAIRKSAFGNSKYLNEINFPEGLETIEDLFEYCYSLTEIHFPASLKSFSFGVVNLLENVTIDEGNPYFKSVDGVVYSKDGTELLFYPPEKNTTEYTVLPGTEKIAPTAFILNFSIEKIVLPGSLTEIGEAAFQFDCLLKEINIPGSVREIGGGAFAGCMSLEDITLPSGITEIKGGTFQICTSLKSINIPDSVKRISDFAFCDCYSLTNITIPENVNYIGEEAFQNASVHSATILSTDADITDCALGTVILKPEVIDRYVALTIEGTLLERKEMKFFYDEDIIAGINERYHEINDEIYSYCTLSPDGTIEYLENQPTVIIGHQDSTAQAYSQANNLTFTSCPLGEHTNIQYNTEGYLASCTEQGYIGGSACLDCETVLEMPEIIPATGHTIVTDAAVPATCTSSGLTEGKHCSVCGFEEVTQSVIAPTDHVDADADNYCDVCGTQTGEDTEPELTLVERIRQAFANLINSIIALFKKLFG